MKILPLIAAALFATLAHAQAYKCKDAAGKLQYQDQPCSAQAGTSGAPVKLHNTARDLSAARLLRQQQDVAQSLQAIEDVRTAGQARQRTAARGSALGFDAYTRIRNGLTTAEVMTIAGYPGNKDYQVGTSPCGRLQGYESWLYPADSDEPNSTIVEFCDGRVASTKRFKLSP